MNQSNRCESCTMPIETAALCEHCTDENGTLQPFEDRFLRMVQWTMHQDPALSRDKAEQQTIAFMATMPAWRNHPEVISRVQGK